MNDLPEPIAYKVRVFADDTIIYNNTDMSTQPQNAWELEYGISSDEV